MYKTSAGKMVIAHLLGTKGFDELEAKGWNLRISGFNEAEQQLYDRMISKGYTKVRIWHVTTAVRGYHDIIAMVK